MDKKQIFFGKQHIIIMWWLGDRRVEAVIVLRSSGVTRESTLLRPRCKSLRGTNKLLARLPWNMCHLFQETGSSFSPLISLFLSLSLSDKRCAFDNPSLWLAHEVRLVRSNLTTQLSECCKWGAVHISEQSSPSSFCMPFWPDAWCNWTKSVNVKTQSPDETEHPWATSRV